MDSLMENKVRISGLAFNPMTPDSAAKFLSTAESPAEWRLRIEYIIAWNQEPISREFWEQVSKHSWVITTAMVLGVVGQELAQGVEV